MVIEGDDARLDGDLSSGGRFAVHAPTQF